MDVRLVAAYVTPTEGLGVIGLLSPDQIPAEVAADAGWRARQPMIGYEVTPEPTDHWPLLLLAPTAQGKQGSIDGAWITFSQFGRTWRLHQKVRLVAKGDIVDDQC